MKLCDPSMVSLVRVRFKALFHQLISHTGRVEFGLRGYGCNHADLRPSAVAAARWSTLLPHSIIGTRFSDTSWWVASKEGIRRVWRSKISPCMLSEFLWAPRKSVSWARMLKDFEMQLLKCNSAESVSAGFQFKCFDIFNDKTLNYRSLHNFSGLLKFTQKNLF